MLKTYSIDDDQISNFLTERALENAGAPAKVYSFLSAEEALKLIEQERPDNVPDLIFLDLNMPMMNGWEFLDALSPRKNDLLGKCRIYILTSSLDTSDTEKANEYELVSGLIHKPLTTEDVQVILSEIGDTY